MLAVEKKRHGRMKRSQGDASPLSAEGGECSVVKEAIGDSFGRNVEVVLHQGVDFR